MNAKSDKPAARVSEFSEARVVGSVRQGGSKESQRIKSIWNRGETAPVLPFEVKEVAVKELVTVVREFNP